MFYLNKISWKTDELCIGFDMLDILNMSGFSQTCTFHSAISGLEKSLVIYMGKKFSMTVHMKYKPQQMTYISVTIQLR